MKLLNTMLIACLGVFALAIQASDKPMMGQSPTMQRGPQWVPYNKMPEGMMRMGPACRVKVSDKMKVGRFDENSKTCNVLIAGKMKPFTKDIEVMAFRNDRPQSIRMPDKFKGHGPAQMPQRSGSGPVQQPNIMQNVGPSND